jgi:hypothetical protein
VNALHIAREGDRDLARAGDGAGDSSILERKSVLMGMAASLGFVFANAAQPSVAAAGTVQPSPILLTQPAYAPKWIPSTDYALGQQVVSPNNDVVSAKVAHTSSAAYATDTLKWTLSSSFGRSLVAPLDSATADQTATIQTALVASHSVVLRAGTWRVDGTIDLDCNQRLHLDAGVTLVRAAAATSTDPIVWMHKVGAVLSGEGAPSSLIVSEKRAPLGVVCIGYKGPSDPTPRQANYNTVNGLEIRGMTPGGQITGAPDFSLYLCNMELSGLTSYFNNIAKVRLSQANVGLMMHGNANGNQISDLHCYAVGDNKQLGGAAVKLSEISGTGGPIENHISGVFHHGSVNATTLYLDGKTNQNALTGFICEQGGASANYIENTDDTVSGNILSAVSNVAGASAMTANFRTKNTLTLDTNLYATTSTVTNSNATNSTVTGMCTHDAYVEKYVTLTGVAEGAKRNFLKVTVPSTAGSYLIETDVQIGSSTNAQYLQSATGGRYLLQCTSTDVTVIEISTCASGADTYLPPLVSGRDVTFAVQAGENGTATANGVIRARYKVPTAVSVTEMSSPSTVTDVLRGHVTLRSAWNSTANRPPARGPGDQFFDTTLGKPIWWNGTAWIDAAGASV